jgi:hypothetical protein
MTSARIIDFDRINAAALNALPALLARWVPDGHQVGREWVARNPILPGLLWIDMQTVAWAANGASGEDITSLYAYLRGVRAVQAARELAHIFQIDPQIFPKHEAEVLAAEAKRVWRGDYDKVSETAFQFFMAHGVKLESRHDKIEEYDVMASMVEAVPAALRWRVSNVFCDSNYRIYFTVTLRSWNLAHAHTIGKLTARAAVVARAGDGPPVDPDEPDIGPAAYVYLWVKCGDHSIEVEDSS